MKIITSLASLAFVFALTTIANADKKSSEYADIELKDLKEAIEKKEVVVIDVNGSKAFEKGHIPSAIDFQAVGAEGLKSKLPENKDTLIVAYCGGPKCSAYKKAANVAKELGYTNVKHLSVGISGWKKAGEAVATVEK